MDDPKNLRYIVFMLTPDTQQYMASGARIDTHDGEIFSDLNDALKYAEDAINEKLCTRFVIGMFHFEQHSERMGITCVETFGFRNDKKRVNQLTLFT